MALHGRHAAAVVAVLAALALAPAAQAHHSQLLGQWHLDNDPAVSDSTPDSSGHGLTAHFNPFDDQVPGRFGNAFNFHGPSLVPTVPANAVLEPQRVTVAAWVRWLGDGNGLDSAPLRYVVAKGGQDCTAASWALYTGASQGDGLRFYVFDGANAITTSAAGGGVWDRAWHAVAGTFDGSTVRLYVDGSEVGTGVPAPVDIVYGLPNRDLTIGGFPNASQCPFFTALSGAAVDEVRVYDRALSAAEIRVLQNPAATSPPVVPEPGSGPQPSFGTAVTAAFTAPAKAKARRLLVLDATATRGATRLLWDVDGDGRNDVAAAGNARYLGLRLGKHREYDVRLTAVAADGARSVTSHAVTVAGTRRKPYAALLPDLAMTSPNERFLGATVANLSCFSEATVAFGVVEAKGCIRHVLDAADVPDKERAVAQDYFIRNELGKIQPPDCRPGAPLSCVNLGLLEGMDVFVAEGELKINGISFTPQGKGSIVVFPALARVVSSDAVVRLKGSGLPTVKLASGEINLDLRSRVRRLTGGRSVLKLFSFDAQQALRDLGGFPLQGQTDVSFVKQGEQRFTEWTVRLALPAPFGLLGSAQPGGEATLKADNARGVVLDTLDLHVDEAYLGGLRLANLGFRYSEGGDGPQGCPARWLKATADVFLGVGEQAGGLRLSPPPARNGIAFCRGGFHSFGGEFVFGPPIPPPQIFPGVFLDAIAFDFRGDSPTVLSGGATISTGKLVRARGGLLAAFASPRAPYVIQAGDGNRTLAGLAGTRVTSTSFAVGGSVAITTPVGPLALGSAHFLYSYPDYIAAGGYMRADLLYFTVSGGADAKLSTATGRFNVHAGGEICLAGGIRIEGIGACVGANAWVSSRGAVACFSAFGATPGVGYHWDDTRPTFYLGVLGDGCKPSRYWVENVNAARVAARAEAPLAFTVKRGETVKNLELTGADGAPAVEVRAPDGETLTTEPNRIRIGTRLRVLAHEDAGRTWIGIEDARPGTYTITPLPRSVPIAGLAATRPEPRPIKASVRGRGTRRVLRYDVGEVPGRRITFVERGQSTWRVLGSASRGKGEIRFTPAVGPAGRRQIVAQVEVDGIPGEPLTLDAYRSAAPKPGRPRRVHVRRTRKALIVSWSRAANAIAYGVRVRQRNGAQRMLRVSARRRRARVRGIAPSQRGIVEVRALAPLGDWGRTRTARFRATARAVDRLRPFRELRRRRRAAQSQSPT